MSLSLKVEDKRDIQLSKKLSYLLRHGAVKEDLNIKQDGFIAVNELLSKSLLQYKFDDIKRVVANNDKNRFSLRVVNDIVEIKANQGHSIDEINDLSLKSLDDVDFDVIHGTYFKNWKTIKIKGLARMKRNHIHFAKGLNFISGLRRSAEVYIYINFKTAKRDGLQFYESENGVILCAGNSNGVIEPKYFLKAVTKSGEVLSLF